MSAYRGFHTRHTEGLVLTAPAVEVTEPDRLRRARQDLRKATTEMHAAAARALAPGKLTDEEVQQLRGLLKRGRVRPGATAEQVEEVSALYREHTRELELCLENSGRNRSAAPIESTIENTSEIAGTSLSEAAAPLAAQMATLPPGLEEDSPGISRQGARLDELDEAQRAQIGQYHELMLLLEGGTPVKDALQQLGLECSMSWVRKMRARYKAQGWVGLLDRRAYNHRPRSLEHAQSITLGWYFARRGAGPKAISELVQTTCTERGLTPPSYEWVKRFLHGLPKAIRLAREQGLDAWDRQAAPIGSYPPTTYANELAEIDDLRGDIWVRVQDRSGEWTEHEVFVTAILDVHSRSILSFTVSTRVPDAWSVALALRKAVLPKSNPGWSMRGLPTTLLADNGNNFRSHAVAASVRALGIRLEFCPPRHPNSKSEIERWFRTLQQGLFAKLPGYKGAGLRSAAAARKRIPELLTLPELRREIENWIVHVYHKRAHEGISDELDRSPGALWEETVRLRIPDRHELDVLLLKSDKVRMVINRGIRFKLRDTRRMVFWAPALVDEWRSKVRIAYNPEDLQSILVYRADTGEFVCEAERMGGPDARYTIADIKRERRRARRGLAERLSQYAAQVEADDRKSADAWREARELTDAILNSASLEDAGAVSPDVISLAERMELRDRGLL